MLSHSLTPACPHARWRCLIFLRALFQRGVLGHYMVPITPDPRAFDCVPVIRKCNVQYFSSESLNLDLLETFVNTESIVGFVGIGRMGLPIARYLLQAGDPGHPQHGSSPQDFLA